MSTTTATVTATPPTVQPTKQNQAQSKARIPHPETQEAHRKYQLEKMAGAFRIFAKMGFADGRSGHISLRDPIKPDTFWINPYAVHFGMLKVYDMVHVAEEGNRIGGAGKYVNAAGLIMHTAIHRARPDINAACHVHSPYGRAWSSFGGPIDMLNQNSCMFYDDLSVYGNFGGVVFAKEEGKRIAVALGSKNKNIIPQSHGLLTDGGTIAEAAAFFIVLERACQTQLPTEASVAADSLGAASGLRKTLVGDEEAAYTKRNTGNSEVRYMQFKPEYGMVLKENSDYLE